MKQGHIEEANNIDETCYSKWQAANSCTSTDGETTVKFLQQYIRLNSILKTITTDKASAFTGRLFRAQNTTSNSYTEHRIYTSPPA